jgi:hypothetical protein
MNGLLGGECHSRLCVQLWMLHEDTYGCGCVAPRISNLDTKCMWVVSFKPRYVISREVCDYRRGMDWTLDLLTTCIHHSELQEITALSLISKFYKLLHAKSSSACSISNSRSLATAFTEADSLASRTPDKWTLSLTKQLHCLHCCSPTIPRPLHAYPLPREPVYRAVA